MRNYRYIYGDLAEIEDFRRLKISDYRGPVSDYLEEGIVTYRADCVMIYLDTEKIGYLCIGTRGEFEKKVLEFFLVDEHRKDAADIFTQAYRSCECNGWYVNPQDHFARTLMLERESAHQIYGYIFSYGCKERKAEIKSDCSLELAEISEAKAIFDLIMLDNFYTGGDVDSVEDRIREGEIYLLKRDEKLVGVGFISVLQRTPQYADLAMIIAPDERRKGYGEYIQKAMVERCYALKLIPAASCGADNVGSRKTLEKAGYYVDGCLLIASTE